MVPGLDQHYQEVKSRRETGMSEREVAIFFGGHLVYGNPTSRVGNNLSHLVVPENPVALEIIELRCAAGVGFCGHV